MNFTLVIPYYNRAEFLPRTLDSLIASTLQPSAVILVDNGSTDGSRQICESFATAHPELPVLLLDENRQGVCFARNKALQYVKTDWVYFFDSDDVLSPDYFEAVSEVLAHHPQVDLIACATRMVYPDGTAVVRKVQYSASPVDQILSGQLSTQSMFLRTDFLKRVGGWNEALPKWNDWELGVRVLLSAPRILWLSSAYHSIYQHDQSLTGSSFSSTLLAIRKAVAAVAVLVKSDKALQLALVSRCIFLAAQLEREKDKSAAIEMRNYAHHLFVINKMQHLYFHLLYAYIRLGGRGAWFISKKVIPFI